jgi:hypothetical protein
MLDELDHQILGLNGLSYPASEELSLANAHRLRYFPALRDNYAGGTSGYVDISVGSDLIAGSASWLEFDIAVTGGDAVLPPNGAMAIFRETIVRARSGQELDRYQHANLHNHDAMPVACTYGTHQTVATAMGAGVTIGNNQALSVCVPLSWLNPFFASSRRIPTQAIGTLRLELLLAPAVEGLIASDVNYQIQNVNVVADTFSLSDAALRSLNMIAANSGLAYEWESVHTTVNTSNGTSANFVSLKSESRALGTTLHIAETSRLTSDHTDSMANEPFEVKQSQWSLGSQYLPVRPITSIPGHYYTLLYSFDSLQHCREVAPQLSMAEFVESHGMVAATLERSSVLQANGQATSSSRPLLADVTWETAAQRTTFMFLRYQRLLLCYSDSNLALKELTN